METVSERPSNGQKRTPLKLFINERLARCGKEEEKKEVKVQQRRVTKVTQEDLHVSSSTVGHKHWNHRRGSCHLVLEATHGGSSGSSVRARNGKETDLDNGNVTMHMLLPLDF